MMLTFERSNTRDRTVEPQDSINFTFVLKSIGGAGSSEFD